MVLAESGAETEVEELTNHIAHFLSLNPRFRTGNMAAKTKKCDIARTSWNTYICCECCHWLHRVVVASLKSSAKKETKTDQLEGFSIKCRK